MKVQLQNELGIVKECKLGFSWTTFFFGIFPALFRGDWKWAIIMFIGNLVTAGFFSVVFSFFYNKIYIKEMLEKGFFPANDFSQNALMSKGIFLANNRNTYSE